MAKVETKKAKAAIKAKVAKIKNNLKRAGIKDMSHVARGLKGGWRKGSACFFIQARINQPAEKIAIAIRKTPYKDQACFSTLAKAIARVKVIQKQAKVIGIKKASL